MMARFLPALRFPPLPADAKARVCPPPESPDLPICDGCAHPLPLHDPEGRCAVCAIRLSGLVGVAM